MNERPAELELLRIPVGVEHARRVAMKNTLAGLQMVVGGFIEFVPLTFLSIKLDIPLILVINEEAKLHGESPNVRATRLYVNSPNVAQRDLPQEPYIAGDAFVATEKKVEDEVELFSLPSHMDWEYFKRALYS